MRFTAVHPDHRRKGIAAAFDRVRLAHAAALKCDKVYGETVVQHGDRIRQLGRLGFTEFYRYVKSERTFVCLAKSVTT